MISRAGWDRIFDQILLPGGGEMRTLRDAGNYITALSKAQQAKAHW